MNEQTWIALDEENNLQAAQYYLLAQHIYTGDFFLLREGCRYLISYFLGLSLSKKDYIDRIPLLQQLKYNLVVLRSKIFEKITEKLESVEITAQVNNFVFKIHFTMKFFCRRLVKT